MLHHDTPVGGVLDLTARLLDLTVHLMCMIHEQTTEGCPLKGARHTWSAHDVPGRDISLGSHREFPGEIQEVNASNASTLHPASGRHPNNYPLQIHCTPVAALCQISRIVVRDYRKPRTVDRQHARLQAGVACFMRCSINIPVSQVEERSRASAALRGPSSAGRGDPRYTRR